MFTANQRWFIEQVIECLMGYAEHSGYKKRPPRESSSGTAFETQTLQNMRDHGLEKSL